MLLTLFKKSTLSFSQLSNHKRLSRDEMVLQSYIINKISPLFAKVPIGTVGFTKPTIVLKEITLLKCTNSIESY